jgi:uncharacterized caspase-like protein
MTCLGPALRSVVAGGLLIAGAPSAGSAEPDPRHLAPVEVRRLALVVGVESYDDHPRVPNALNDARQMERALGATGFETRFLGNPETADAIVLEVQELAQRAGDEPATFVFFFAGHGFQEGAFNYLVPGKARRDELLGDSVPVTSVLQDLAGPRASGRRRVGVTVVLLDACRTTGHVRTPDQPASQPGFATVAVPGRGTVVSLAAKYNSPARSRVDPADSNSPYTAALSRFLPRAAQPVSDMFDRVQAYVEELTHDEQSPEQVDALGGVFYFRPTLAERAAEEAAWRTTLDTNRRECVIGYLRRFPDSRFVRAALEWAAGAQDSPTGGVECPVI